MTLVITGGPRGLDYGLHAPEGLRVLGIGLLVLQ